MVHAKVEPERELKVACNYSDVCMAPRKNEVKQQQDWRLFFVDRPETCGITDRLDELMSENVDFDRALPAKPARAHAHARTHTHTHTALPFLLPPPPLTSTHPVEILWCFGTGHIEGSSCP